MDRLQHRQRAQVFALLPGLVLTLLAVGGIAFDLGRLYIARQDLQNLAEASATSAASCYCGDDGFGNLTNPPPSVATQVFDAHASALPDGLCTPRLESVTPLSDGGWPTTEYSDGTPLPPGYYFRSDWEEVTVSCNDWHPTILALLPGMASNFGARVQVEAAGTWTWYVIAGDPNPEVVQVAARPVPIA
jgi:hypothetical protein